MTMLMLLPYTSTAFVPVDSMPTWLQGFAEHQPMTPVIEIPPRSVDGHTLDNQPAWAPRGASPYSTSRWASLGAETREHPMGNGVQVVVDEMGQTTVPGVYAAGNLVDISAQVMGAAAAGTRVGAATNIDLIMSDLRA